MSQKFNDAEEQDMPSWPDTVKRGLEMLYGEYNPDEEVKIFTTRWGGLDQKTFLRVLAEGQGEDRLLAICVVGEGELPQVSTLLRPFLQSSDPKERWVSALYLGRRKESAVFPVLVSMLTEFLPSEKSPTLLVEQSWFDEWRGSAVSTLLLWENPSLVAIFREAFMTSVKAEQFLSDLPYKRTLLQRWHSYQDGLAYAMGRLGAFGVLTGFQLSPTRLRIAVLKIAAGYCHAENYHDEFWSGYPWEIDQQFRREMRAVLGQRFGLSEEDQYRYLDSYKKDYYAREEQSDTR